jgi:hypothetical protein
LVRTFVSIRSFVLIGAKTKQNDSKKKGLGMELHGVGFGKGSASRT